MQFFSVRCLSCQNLDSEPRFNYEEIPYCSQCASTSNLVPETPRPQQQQQQQQQHQQQQQQFQQQQYQLQQLQHQQQQQYQLRLQQEQQQEYQPQQQQHHQTSQALQQQQPQHTSMSDEDLSALFSRNLHLQPAPPTPPLTSPISPKFSISQHYNHSLHHPPPSPPPHDAVSAQLLSESRQHAETARQTDREYAEYLMASDLSSPTSANELEIALAHGIISEEEYRRSLHEYRRAERARPRALEEGCSAMEMLSAAKGVPWYSAYNNESYGGIDASMMEDEDEEAPCMVYSGDAGGRLRPFDL